MKFERCIPLVLLSAIALPVMAQPVIVQDNLRAWQQTAQTGRADLLLLGDSVVLYQGHGWDAGIHAAAARRYGLAGTGIVAGENDGQGQGWYYGGSIAPTWSLNPAVAFGDPDEDGPFGFLTATNPSTLALGLRDPLDAAAGYTLDVWAAGDETTGTFTPHRRLGEPPWNERQAAPVPNLTETTRRLSYTFAPTADERTELRLQETLDATVYGLRATTFENRGVAITSIGRGGFSALDFYRDFYDPMLVAARYALLDRLTDRGSGKLAVFLFEGFNDRNETEPSLTQRIADADSPEAFVDNVRTLIDAIHRDWLDSGHHPDDLSFLTAGMYPVASGNAELRDYAAALESLATVDDRVSFVDLHAFVPDYDTLDALGYYTDGLHPTPEGSAYFGERLMAALDTNTPPGDFNGSGLVEQGDLNLVLQNWGLDSSVHGAPTGWTTFPPDGVIDQGELNAVLSHWGADGLSGFNTAAVPETAALALLALLALRGRR